MVKNDILEAIVTDDTPYRKNLEIPDSIGFGYEVEMGVTEENFDSICKNFSFPGWSRTTDPSIETLFGLELISPVYRNSKNTYKELKAISEYLSKYEKDFSWASFQLNIDNIFSNKEDMYNFLCFFAAYEDVLYHFCQGKDTHIRHNAFRFSNTIGKVMYKSKNYDEAFEKLHNRKDISLNLKKNYMSIPKIIEFRQPNGTDDCWLWQNYTNVFINSMLAIKNNKNIDYDKVRNYLKRFKKSTEGIPYDHILKVSKAFEFCDIIFQNDKDKLYFMKQYLNGLSDKKILQLKDE